MSGLTIYVPLGTDEYPTLLHWAARFGLERLCWQLLECPGGGAAVALRNVRHRVPAELARDHKHHRLADVLQDHMVKASSRQGDVILNI